jgi:hypothetical protein
MRGSGVAGTPSALFGFEKAFGIDLSLERRHEGRSGGLGRLARVVGRVESVCTDPSAKGPTGPFCLVHPMVPVLPAAYPTDRAALLALLGQPNACSIAEPSLRSRSALLLDLAWGRVQEAERERPDPTPPSAANARDCVR